MMGDERSKQKDRGGVTREERGSNGEKRKLLNKWGSSFKFRRTHDQ